MSRPARKLRDLRGRDRYFAIALFVLVLVPFVVALVRAFRDGWIPSGDEANIAIRALDVFSRHPPLVGLPSTSSAYGIQIAANHPGPIEFYLLAIPVRALGMSAGPLFTAATINAGFVFIALWAVFRRLGLTAMLWAGALALAVIWSAGTAVLTDTLSSNMTMYSLLCTAVLAWALIDGDFRLLPLTVLVASYAAQQHLAADVIVLFLMTAAAISLAVQIVARSRRGDAPVMKTAVRWSLAALVVAVVCWATVAYDTLTSRPSNLHQIVRFARDNSRPTLGFDSGVKQALHAVTPPTVLTRTDTTGLFFVRDIGPAHLALGIALVVALGVIVWWLRVRSRGVARLAFVALVLLAAGIVDGSNVPDSVELTRVNLYRWSWAAVFVTWTALGLGVALFIARALDQRPVAGRARRLAPVALLVVSALIATSIAFVGGKDDHNRERRAFASEKDVAEKVLARVDHHRPVVVVSDGLAASLSISPYLILRLVRAGVRVEIANFLTPAYGTARRYDPASGAAALLVVSGEARKPSGPGRLIAIHRFFPERSALLDELSAAARGVKVEIAPGTGERIMRDYTGLRRVAVNALLEQLPDDPRGVLATPEFLQLLLDGLLRSPTFDTNKIRRLLELPYVDNTISNEEQVEVRLLSPSELLAARFAQL